MTSEVMTIQDLKDLLNRLPESAMDNIILFLTEDARFTGSVCVTNAIYVEHDGALLLLNQEDL